MFSLFTRISNPANPQPSIGSNSVYKCKKNAYEWRKRFYTIEWGI